MSPAQAQPVSVARAHPTASWEFTLRACETFEELDQCVALQKQVWGSPDAELVPRTMFVLASRSGGHVLGAWNQAGALAGFALAVAAHEPAALAPRAEGVEPRRSLSSPPVPYLHSHMLAVAPGFRDRGLGFALKMAQRQDALRRSIERMRWTFDPLVAKNAFFNLRRVGATVRTHLPDLYGQTRSQPQGGLPTDRLLAEWPMSSERACKAAAGEAPWTEQAGHAEVTQEASIELPAEVAAARQAGAYAVLRQAQQSLSRQFTAAFARGLEAFDFAPDGRGGGAYRLRSVAADG